MIKLILSVALAAGHGAPAGNAGPSTDITVIGRKLAQTEGVIRTNVLTRNMSCEVDKSSGDLRIDDAVCKIAVSCLRQRFEGDAFRNCVLAGRKRFLNELTEQQQAAGE